MEKSAVRPGFLLLPHAVYTTRWTCCTDAATGLPHSLTQALRKHTRAPDYIYSARTADTPQPKPVCYIGAQSNEKKKKKKQKKRERESESKRMQLIRMNE